jgi:hypothetical protein
VTLARSKVQLVCDRFAVCLSEPAHGPAFRQVLANETVRVLVRATFPRVVGSGEVDEDARCFLDLAVPSWSVQSPTRPRAGASPQLAASASVPRKGVNISPCRFDQSDPTIETDDAVGDTMLNGAKR